MVSDEQRAQLLRKINRRRVKQRDGFSYLEAYDVRAMLIRIFDFGGWSEDLINLTLLYEQQTETKAGKAAYKVAYRATVCLSLPGVAYTEAAVGESIMPEFKRGDCHDMAIKTAQSQALKRCAVNLGDQFGISLYNAGSTDALIRQVIGVDTVGSEIGLDDHVTELAGEDEPTPEPEYDTNRVEPEPAENGRDFYAEALAPIPAGKRSQVHYARLLTDMVMAGVAQNVVVHDGQQVTLKALVDAKIAQAQRKAAS